jgi:catechol 2,3-dioxygenase-like lactoylglutathione lyase family enzyme
MGRIARLVSVRGFDHVSVSTADLDRSISFYSDLLGIPMVDRGEDASEQLRQVVGVDDVSIRWADLDLGEERVLELLEFITPRGGSIPGSLWNPGSGHIGLWVDDLDALHARLLEANVPVRSRPVTWREPGPWDGVRILFAIDPDGVWVELVERPRAPSAS